jgi:Protein of unknown function (DUF2490)
MQPLQDFRNCCWLLILLALCPAAVAQIDEFLPEVDLYYKLQSSLRLWVQAKETAEAGAPVTAEFGPSLDFYVRPFRKLVDITKFDNDDSKSRPAVFTIGYRYLPYPDAPPTNRLEPVLTVNLPTPKIKTLISDRNRFDLDWQSGVFTWRYRNRLQLERTWHIASYHLSPYASAEVYYESQYSKWADTALSLGCFFPIGRHFDLNPYYEHQNQTGSSPNQQYNQFGLMFNIFYGSK